MAGQYLGLLKLEPAGWAALSAELSRSDTRWDTTGLLRRLIAREFAVRAVPVPGPWHEFDSARDCLVGEPVLRELDEVLSGRLPARRRGRGARQARRMRAGAAGDMTDKVFYLLHGLQDRYSALYQDNIARLGPRDVLVASIGSSGQSYLGGILVELGLNYADAYTEALREDGASEPVAAYDDYRERLATPDAPRRPWPRFVKTHLTPRFFTGRPLLGVWILVRDPRDALYSWYRFRTEFVRDQLDRLATSFEDWLCRPVSTGSTTGRTSTAAGSAVPAAWPGRRSPRSKTSNATRCRRCGPGCARSDCPFRTQTSPRRC
ncbi:sulfotransferase domain-containing protein [Amycolatopsis methanolica]|uniref:sulfotransferase domain-containing protein n=1 Tax=Amycolatopsis methanolica TaxID=1814 RepID=UPI0034372B7B